MRRITFSRNYTLSLSRTCRCYCKYCAFATHAAHLHPPDEVGNLPFGKSVLETEHRPRMGDLGEACGRCRAEPFGRRIRPNQMREALLQLAVLADQRVIFPVGDLRRVLVVIEPVVPRDLLRQPHQPVGRLGLGQLLKHRR